MHTLQDEILVVMRYEVKTVPSGKKIGQTVALFRQNSGDDRVLYVQEMKTTLKDMADEGFLYPWVYSVENRKLKHIENIDLYDPYALYYTLTYRGYRAHLEATDRLAVARGDFRKFMRKKQGRS